MGSTDGQENRTDSATTSARPVGEEAVLEVLAEFQAGVDSLKSLYQQRQAMAAKLAERERELAAEAERLGSTQKQLQERETEIQSARTKLGEIDKQLQVRDAEMKRQREAIEESQRQTDQIKAEAEKAKRDFEEERSRLQKELDEQRQKLSAKQGELDRAQIETKFARDAVEAQKKVIETAQADLITREGSLREKLSALENGGGGAVDSVAKARLTELESQLKRAVEKETQLRTALEAAVKARDEATAKAEAAAKAAAAAPVAGGDAGAKKQIEELRAKLAAQQSLADEQAKALSAERAEKQRLAKDLSATASSAPQLKQALDAEKAKLERAVKTVNELRAERDALATQAATLKKQFEAASAQARGVAKVKPTESEAWYTLRKKRLARFRSLVKEQSLKVQKASETLRSRFEHAEKITAQRAELADAAEAVRQAQMRVNKARGKTRASAFVFYSVMTSAILAGMSWLITSIAVPGTYIASAVLAAQGRGRELNAAELAEWQSFHTQLIADPRFLDTAAERFARRGMPTLGTAPAVKSLIEKDLSTRSPQDGELVMELRGKGDERTARVLETLSSALASQANAARQQRADGATTAIKQASTAGREPIDNLQLIYAGAAWVLSTMAAGVVGMFLWNRMSNAKVSFEKQGQVEAVLDEARWAAPKVAAQMRKDRRSLP